MRPVWWTEKGIMALDPADQDRLDGADEEETDELDDSQEHYWLLGPCRP